MGHNMVCQMDGSSKAMVHWKGQNLCWGCKDLLEHRDSNLTLDALIPVDTQIEIMNDAHGQTTVTAIIEEERRVVGRATLVSSSSEGLHFSIELIDLDFIRMLNNA